MLFILITIIVWAIFVTFFYRVNKARFSFSRALLPLVIFSIMVSLDLGINYLAGMDVIRNDGIALHGVFAPFIFGDRNWSIDLFMRYYHISIFISGVLLFGLIAVQFIRPARNTDTV